MSERDLMPGEVYWQQVGALPGLGAVPSEKQPALIGQMLHLLMVRLVLDQGGHVVLEGFKTPEQVTMLRGYELVVHPIGDGRFELTLRRKAEAEGTLGVDTEATRRQVARRCPLCERVSYHPEDVRHHYCACCGGPGWPRACPHHPVLERPYPAEQGL